MEKLGTFLLWFDTPKSLADGIERPHLAETFSEIRGVFETPEHIDDSPETSPSHRILREYPAYRKVLHGPAIAEAIGVAKMRKACPHFDDWLRRLEFLQTE